MICGLKSAEMNMQVSFTRELLALCPDVLLCPSKKVNVTRLIIKQETEMKFVVQSDIIEIRLLKHNKDIDDICRMILKAIQRIVVLRADRASGWFDYHLRTLRSPNDYVQSSESIGSLDKIGNYWYLHEKSSNSSSTEMGNVPSSFEKALQSLV